MSQPTVIKTLKFTTPAEAAQYLTKMGAQYRKLDPQTGRPLYKAASGLVFRPSTQTSLDVLTNCVC
jgi:hypothetical protein